MGRFPRLWLRLLHARSAWRAKRTPIAKATLVATISDGRITEMWHSLQ